MKRVIRFATLAATALLLCAIAYAQQQPPAQIPLGDLVKQKAVTKAKKVVTDDDMPARAPEPAAPTASSGTGDAQPATDATKAADSKADAPHSQEEQARQDKIKELRESEAAEGRIINKMEEELAKPDLSENRRQMFTDTMMRARELQEQFAKERQALEKGPAPAPKPTQSTGDQEQ